MKPGGILLLSRLHIKGRHYYLWAAAVLGCATVVWPVERQSSLNRGLIAAIEHRDYPKAAMLVREGADVNVRQRSKPTGNWFMSIVDLLNIRDRDATRGTAALPLLLSGLNHISDPVFTDTDPNYFAVAIALIQGGADCNATDIEGWTPLLLAVQVGANEVVPVLLAHGADANRVSNDGVSPLMVASEGRNTNTVRMLLRHGANVNAVSAVKDTPLIYAVTAGDEKVAKLLCDAGADVSVRDDDGETALTIANDREYRHGVALVIRRKIEHDAHRKR